MGDINTNFFWKAATYKTGILKNKQTSCFNFEKQSLESSITSRDIYSQNNIFIILYNRI